MIRRLALTTIFGSVLLIGAAYGVAFNPALPQWWSNWLMVVGVAAIMVGMLMLGALSHERPRGLGIVFGALFLILVLSFGAALLLPADDPAAIQLWLGLPPRAAVVIYGVGLLPLFLLPLAYALSFRDPVPLDSVVEAARQRAHTRTQWHQLEPSDDEGRGTMPVGAAASPAVQRRRLENN